MGHTPGGMRLVVECAGVQKVRSYSIVSVLAHVEDVCAMRLALTWCVPNVTQGGISDAELS